MWLVLVVLAVGAASAYTVAFRLGEGVPGWLAFDVYGYFYPNMLYALRSLRDGGGGLLWNPFQNCGQPFLGITETGLFYPLNVLFLVLPPALALRGVIFSNLVIGGLGSYGLGRQIGVSRLGAMTAAIAFTLGNMAYHMAVWMPTVQAPFVWLPVVMLCCERLVQAPSLRRALLLGLALAAGLLPGHPQFVLFSCQLVALRLLWSLLDRAERRHIARALGGVALAALVMLLLTAVQFLSSLEVIAESVRHGALRQEEIAPRGEETLAAVATSIRQNDSLAPFTIIAGMLAMAAIAGTGRRRIALFYFLAGLLFLVLSLGFSTRLGQLYFRLPISGLFREPMRFRFVTAFCVSVLIGLAIDVLGRGNWRAVAVTAAALAGLYVWVGHLSPIDWRLAAALLGGGLLAAALPVARPVGLVAIAATVVLAPFLSPSWTATRFLADDGALRVHAEVFGRLQQRLSPQDRVQFVLPSARHEARLQEKTAMLFQLPALTDYELQLSQRYAEYGTMMRRSQQLSSLNQVTFPGPWNLASMSWPLVDLAAGRYLIVDKSHQRDLDPDGRLQLQLLDHDKFVSIYENPSALPRAYYVPQIAVEPARDARLSRLARSGEDRRRLALVSAAPPLAFLGVPGNDATADARFVVDEPEHVVIETAAPERGFLFLADQYFPAWSATVNGEPAPILIGNHAFRLVEVPKGPVTVEFRYRSHRLWIGALISAATLLAVGLLLVIPRRGARAARASAAAIPA